MNEEPKKYRKKPVVIDAMLLTEMNVHDVCKWSGAKPIAYKNTHNPTGKRGVAGITLATLEGNMMGEFGDFIIKGVKGEFYPCKPDIFEATYEPVSPEANTAVIDLLSERSTPASGDLEAQSGAGEKGRL